jgi:ribosomal protein L3 glutamine methyltransferase
VSRAENAVTVAGLIRETARRFRAAKLFYGHGTSTPGDEAAWLVLHSLRIPFEESGSHSRRAPSDAELLRVERLVERRIRERIPVAYLIHEAWLGDFRFYIDRRVIVPRSFIAEILSDGIIPLLHRPVRRALDLCTGSGCLAILLAHAFEGVHVDAVDLSSGALEVAHRNVTEYGLLQRISLMHADLFNTAGRRRYDLIVSNPPYVDAAAMQRLPQEYRSEPRMSLAAGKDGLLLVRRILADAKRHLAPNGTLVCEIGHNREALEHAYPKLPFTWLDTSAGDGLVFSLERDQLPG